MSYAYPISLEYPAHIAVSANRQTINNVWANTIEMSQASYPKFSAITEISSNIAHAVVKLMKYRDFIQDPTGSH